MDWKELDKKWIRKKAEEKRSREAKNKCQMCGREVGIFGKEVNGRWYCRRHAKIQERGKRREKKERKAKEKERKQEKKEKKKTQKKEAPKGGKLPGWLRFGTKVCPEHGEVGQVEGDRCPHCNKHLSIKRNPLGILVSFGIFFGIIFGMLNYAFGSFASLIGSLGFAEPITLYLVAGISAIFAFVLASQSLLKGIMYSILIVVALGVVTPLVAGIPLVLGNPNIPGIGGIDIMCYFGKLFSGDFQTMQECYETLQDGDGGMPRPECCKSYNTLEMKFGRKDDYGYVISTVFANEPYTLDISLINSNTEESGIKFEEVIIEKVTMTKNDFVETPGSVECGDPNHVDSSCPILLNVDTCNVDGPCRIRPEEEMWIYVDFPPSNKTVNVTGNNETKMPCKLYYCRIRDDICTPVTRTFRSVKFSVNATYEQNVTHKRTLGVAASYEDMLKFKDDQDLEREIYQIEPPSAGPIDLIIDFTSPYYLRERSESKIKMEVWVSNEKSGRIKPGEITVKAVGDFPEWLVWAGDTERCTFNDVTKTITLTKFSDRFLILRNPVKYVCDFKIENFPSDVSYQTATFTGEMEYIYTQGASTDSVSVDRTFCD